MFRRLRADGAVPALAGDALQVITQNSSGRRRVPLEVFTSAIGIRGRRTRLRIAERSASRSSPIPESRSGRGSGAKPSGVSPKSGLSAPR